MAQLSDLKLKYRLLIQGYPFPAHRLEAGNQSEKTAEGRSNRAYHDSNPAFIGNALAGIGNVRSAILPLLFPEDRRNEKKIVAVWHTESAGTIDMRKRIVSQTQIQDKTNAPEKWLDLEQIATVEVTSEDPDFLIESIFRFGGGPGWRAMEKGEQQIRIIFDEPTAIRRLQLPIRRA